MGDDGLSDFHDTDMDRAWAGYGEAMSETEERQAKDRRDRNTALLAAWERLARAHVYRYIDGVLVPCEWDTRTASISIVDEEAARVIIIGPRFPPQIDTGLHRIDLKAEQNRSGVPAWWAPNLSRRQRCITWARTPRAERMRLAVRALRGPQSDGRLHRTGAWLPAVGETAPDLVGGDALPASGRETDGAA